MNIAIAVMSFNRPDYLDRSLNSIRDAIVMNMDSPNVYLFQDGIFNPKSGEFKTDSETINRNKKVFYDCFPRGEFMNSDVNLGVGLNFDRAESFLFNEKNYDVVLFFEDDMEVDSRYLQAIYQIARLALNDDRIGMFACYGNNHLASHEVQTLYKAEFVILQHSWGFGLTRNSYLRRKPLTDRYVDIIKDIDYSHKDSKFELIHQLQEEIGLTRHVISQDMMKYMITHALGQINLNIVPVLAKYIGVTGVHSTKTHYDLMGYDKTIMFDPSEPVPSFRPLTQIQFDNLREKQHQFIIRSSPYYVA